MANIRDIFAKNLREYRRKGGFTQAKLAEKANISTHYIAMIELAQNFPKADIIERLAMALNIEIYELFFIPPAATIEISELHKVITTELKEIVHEAVETAFKTRDERFKRHNYPK